MRNRNLQYWVTTGHLTLPVVTLICITCWLLTGFFVPSPPEEANTYLLDQWVHDSTWPSWIMQVMGFTLYAIIGYSLIQINNAFAIIRMRASVQTSLFFLLITACPMLHHFHATNLAALALILSLYYLLKSYQQAKPASFLFHSFAFMGIGSIAFPQLTLLAPVWLVGAYSFKSLTLRSFYAALLGWFVPYWLLFAHAYFHGQMELFYAPFIELGTFAPLYSIAHLPLWEIVMLIYLFIQFAVSALHIFASGYQDKIRARSYLNFLIFVCIILFILVLVQPSHSYSYLTLLLPLVSILMGHLYVLTNNRLANVFFICSFVGLIVLFIFNIWMLL